MTERAKPYVGVSGVVNPEQQDQLKELFERSGLARYDRQLLLGIKAVHKTQWLDIENKYGREWYPVGPDEFARAVEPGGTFNIAQLCLDQDQAATPEYRESFVKRVASRGNPWLDGMQFDMLDWHTDDALLDFLETPKRFGKVILQCHRAAMESLGPRGIAQRLGEHARSLDYVLFDASHGKGVPMRSNSLLHFVDAAYESPELAHVGVGIAGGLDADVIKKELPVVVATFPDICVDTEGKVHPTAPDGSRPISMAVTENYFDGLARALSEVY